jgi:hypothetical protein
VAAPPPVPELPEEPRSGNVEDPDDPVDDDVERPVDDDVELVDVPVLESWCAKPATATTATTLTPASPTLAAVARDSPLSRRRCAECTTTSRFR